MKPLKLDTPWPPLLRAAVALFALLLSTVPSDCQLSPSRYNFGQFPGHEINSDLIQQEP